MDNDKPLEVKDPKIWAAFEDYCKWASIPKHYHGMSKEELEKKGLPEEFIELVSIGSSKEFAEIYKMDARVVRKWDRHPDLAKKVKENWKLWAKRATPDILAKFQEKLLVEGDAARMKLWLQSIEGEGVEEEQKSNSIQIGIQAILKNMKEDGKEPGKEPDKELTTKEGPMENDKTGEVLVDETIMVEEGEKVSEVISAERKTDN